MSDAYIRGIPENTDPRPVFGTGRGDVRPAVPQADGELAREAEARAPGVDRLELSSRGQSSYAIFTVQPKTGIVSIKIVDADSGEVIREIPPEEILHIAEQAQ